MNNILRTLFVIALSIMFGIEVDGYSASAGVNAHKRNYKNHQKQLTLNNLSIKNRVMMCDKSVDCPKYKYCCEIIPNAFNICCNDPMKAVENKRPLLIPIPIQDSYSDY